MYNIFFLFFFLGFPISPEGPLVLKTCRSIVIEILTIDYRFLAACVGSANVNMVNMSTWSNRSQRLSYGKSTTLNRSGWFPESADDFNMTESFETYPTWLDKVELWRFRAQTNTIRFSTMGNSNLKLRLLSEQPKMATCSSFQVTVVRHMVIFTRI